MIIAIRHFGIEVVDILPAVNFYASLGFKLFYHALENWSTEAVADIRHIVKLMAPGGGILEIIEHAPRLVLKENAYSHTHICFQCKDIEATCKDLESKGCTVITPLRPSPDKTVMLAFYKDPFGLTLEIVEVENAERGDNSSAGGVETHPEQEPGTSERVLNFGMDCQGGTSTSC